MLNYIFVVVLILCLIFYLSFPNIVFEFIFKKPKRSKKVPKYYQGTPHYIASRKGMAIMDEIGHEDAYIESFDGLKLHAYIYKAEQPSKKFVLGIHGYRSYARPEYGPYIEFYRKQGYNLLLPDLRGHAPSQGEYIGFGIYDRLDCVDWAKYIVQTYGDDVEIILHGVSMGAATVLSASSEDLPKQVQGIVADCGYSDPMKVLATQLQLPDANQIMLKVEKLCEKKIGYDLHSITALKQVAHAKVPIFFIQGGKDTMVPSYMVHELYKACPTRKRMLYVTEAAHAESICKAKAEYEHCLIDFFNMNKGN